MSHAGAALLAEVADRVGLTRELSRALAGLRERRRRHDPGRVIRDLAVMLADGGDCLSDLRAVRDQQPLFGPVASDSDGVSADRSDRRRPERCLRRCARRAARARARAWELGARPERIVIDVDATLIGAHTEKEGAAVNFKGTFGFHPLLAYLDEQPRGAGRGAAPGQRRRAQRRAIRSRCSSRRSSSSRATSSLTWTPRSCCAPTRPARRTSSARPRATPGSASWSGSI